MDKDIDILVGKKAREFLDALLNSIEAGFTQVFERTYSRVFYTFQ